MIVTKKIEDFTTTVVTGSNEVKTMKLSHMMGKKGMVLFFYPKDFTFVCPSEIIAFNNKYDEFKSRGYEVVGCSVDNEFCHLAWKNTEVDKGGIGQIAYPLISDMNRELSKYFDILFDESVALRASFLIEKDMTVRHAVINDLPLGRSIDEMLRMTDALNFFKEHGDVCPANWRKGQAAMKATPEGVKDYLSKNSQDLK